jgi:hypothetical protein
MIERKLRECSLEKVIPDDDLLRKAHREFHRSQSEDKFEEIMHAMKETGIKVPKDLKRRVRGIFHQHTDLRWGRGGPDHKTQLSQVRAKKEKSKRKSGDFTAQV